MKKNAWYLLFFVVAGYLLYRGYRGLSIGMRQNNPGNIRVNPANDWLGKVKSFNEFEAFSSPQYGVRAIGRLLNTYYSQGLITIRQMVNRYAPPSENDTGSYVSNVSEWLNINPDEMIFLDAVKPELVAAIIRQEQGYDPYEQQFINDSIYMMWG